VSSGTLSVYSLTCIHVLVQRCAFFTKQEITSVTHDGNITDAFLFAWFGSRCEMHTKMDFICCNVKPVLYFNRWRYRTVLRPLCYHGSLGLLIVDWKSLRLWPRTVAKKIDNFNETRWNFCMYTQGYLKNVLRMWWKIFVQGGPKTCTFPFAWC